MGRARLDSDFARPQEKPLPLDGQAPVSQLIFESLLSEGAGELFIFSGYSFSIERDILDLSSGLVTGPRWAKQCRREYPAKKVILDNGAFPAWNAGENLSYEDQIEDLLRAVDQTRGLIVAVIAPDIVGGAGDSWDRTIRSLENLAGLPLLLPVQEGIDIDEAVRVAQEIGAGLFIGGKTMKFKIEAAKAVDFRVYTHAGRINRDGWLHTFSNLVDAVDSTTWVRSQSWNKRFNWAQILRRYARENDGNLQRIPLRGSSPATKHAECSS